MQNSFRKRLYDFATAPAGWITIAYVSSLEILGNLVLTFIAWMWWIANIEPAKAFGMVLVCGIVHPLLVYETGYKKCYRQGMRKYFYAVYLVPGILTMLGIVIGLVVKRVF